MDSKAWAFLKDVWSGFHAGLGLAMYISLGAAAAGFVIWAFQ